MSASSPQGSRIHGPSRSFPTAIFWSPERPGRLRVIRGGTLDPHAISGVPPVRTDGNGGLMDVALYPQFADNRLVYLTYTKPVGNGMGAPALARGKLESGALTDVRDLLVTDAYEGKFWSQRPCRLWAGRQALHVHGRKRWECLTGPRQPARQDPASQ